MINLAVPKANNFILSMPQYRHVSIATQNRPSSGTTVRDGEKKMKRYLAVALATSTILFAGQVMAAEVDMSKMTCKDAAALGKGKLAAVAIWISGN